jgi:hypothetical protein
MFTNSTFRDALDLDDLAFLQKNKRDIDKVRMLMRKGNHSDEHEVFQKNHNRHDNAMHKLNWELKKLESGVDDIEVLEQNEDMCRPDRAI